MVDHKWTGTAADRSYMDHLKQNQQVKRNFGSAAMFGFASTLLATWEVVVVTLDIALLNGGTAGLFWNYIACIFGYGLVYVSIAELSSILPSSGGQYIWVGALAPRPCRHFLSYITGWLCVITWQTGLAGGGYVAASLVQGLFVLNIHTYEYKSWHTALLTLVFILAAIFFNTLLARHLPIMEGIFVILHILGGVTVFIPLWFLLPIAKGASPLVDFSNLAGWQTTGLSVIVGVIGPMAAATGFDCSTHMAEETKDSSRTVPRTLLFGYMANIILGLFALLTCIYTIGPLDQALNASTGYPILNMFFNATGSLPASNTMAAVIIINFAASTTGSLAAASRQLWAFARNHGVPFSQSLAPEKLAYDLPLMAVFVSAIIPIVIALLSIVSTDVLGIILSLYNSALNLSYITTICCALLYRLCFDLPQGRFSLGKWGGGINAAALVFLVPAFVFSLFPSTPKPSLVSMNWASPMVGGVLILATVYYITRGRKLYKVQDIDMEELGRKMAERAAMAARGGVAGN